MTSDCSADPDARAAVHALWLRAHALPICVVGHPAAALGGRTPRDWLIGEWSEPPEPAHLRGLIGRVGIPRRLQAAVYDQGVQIQLIGYDTEQEIMRTVDSLRLAGGGRPGS